MLWERSLRRTCLPCCAAERHRDLIITLAAKHRLPAVYGPRFFVTSGGRISYGADPVDQYRRAAGYVDRSLRAKSRAICRSSSRPSTS
jgi:putative ABC transport system substrate-binding protein